MNENELYHKDTTRISKSGLDLINLAPAKYYEKYLKSEINPFEKIKHSEALVTGSAYHKICLEYEDFNNEFVVNVGFDGVGSRSKQQEFNLLHKSKQQISVQTYDQISRMRDVLWAHPLAKMLIRSGEAEKTIKWIDNDTKAPCKARLDFFNSESYIVDLKTTEDASEQGFLKSVLKYRYDVQTSFYTDGCKAIGIPLKRFIFIAQEKKPPYLVKCHFLGEKEIQIGRIKYKQNLETYMECKRTNQWKGYEETFNEVLFPTRELEKYGMNF